MKTAFSPAAKTGHPEKIWQDMLAASITQGKDLTRVLAVDKEEISRVAARFPMRINPYFLSLIKKPHGPLWLQAVPGAEELLDPAPEDPLCEDARSPAPGILHRYPDRVVFLVESQCALYCRYCMRKRRVGRAAIQDRDKGLSYIRNNPQVREVVLSGGDPLIMEDGPLFSLLESLYKIPHVEVLRIHTRVPGVLPQRITPGLAKGLGRFAPLFMNIQFNHPDEITHEAEQALALLAEAGIPLGSQTVLLAGVNDDPRILAELFRGLLKIRVRPYYLHQLDRVRGTGHFHVPLNKGLRIMEKLRGRISGMAVPHFMIDLPGGGGKVPCLPEYRVSTTGNQALIRNFQGRVYPYTTSR